MRQFRPIALLVAPLLLAAAGAAWAQSAGPDGTQLSVSAHAEATRVPDVATISAGVVTQAADANAAMQANAKQMDGVMRAIRAAGIAERDIQTSSINLNPEYRYGENQPPTLTGYQASNQVSVRFRDIAETGAILDALVAQGANQINGPMLSIDEPEAALDEARRDAITKARARAQLYAQAIGKRVGRILSISESGNFSPPYPVPVMRMEAMAADASTKIVPGEQTLSVTLSVSFELE